MAQRLQDKTALVTGGSTGIGFETARRFLAEGVRRVVITGLDRERLEDAARSLGERAVPVRADVRSTADLDALAAAAREALDGRLDVLFANAGIGGFAPVEALDEAGFDAQFDTT